MVLLLCVVVCGCVVSGLFGVYCPRISLQKEGVKKIHDIGPLSAFEKEALDKMVPELEASIQKGVKFVRAA